MQVTTTLPSAVETLQVANELREKLVSGTVAHFVNEAIKELTMALPSDPAKQCGGVRLKYYSTYILGTGLENLPLYYTEYYGILRLKSRVVPTDVGYAVLETLEKAGYTAYIENTEYGPTLFACLR